MEETMNQEEKLQRMKEKEIVFCRLKAEGKSDIEAAEQAGFLKQTGEKLSKQERIQKEIMRQLKEKKKQNIADDEEILQFLTSVMKGDAYIEKSDSIMKDRMKAAELLGKRQNTFEQSELKNDAVIIVDDIVKGK